MFEDKPRNADHRSKNLRKPTSRGERGATTRTMRELLLFSILTWTTWCLLRLIKSRKSPPSSRSVALVVLGDIGRSPRMMYHATSFAEHDFVTNVISYGGIAVKCHIFCSAEAHSMISRFQADPRPRTLAKSTVPLSSRTAALLWAAPFHPSRSDQSPPPGCVCASCIAGSVTRNTRVYPGSSLSCHACFQL